MNTRSVRASRADKGFTLIELVVVIAVLAILAATALPRFSNIGADARIAKMKAAQAALQTGAALFHAQWLAAGSPADTNGNSASADSIVSLEGRRIAFINGYPDVGGDGADNLDALTTASSGIAVAAGDLADFAIATSGPNQLLIMPDSNHASCMVSYTQAASVTTQPVIDASGLTTVNCT